MTTFLPDDLSDDDFEAGAGAAPADPAAAAAAAGMSAAPGTSAAAAAPPRGGLVARVAYVVVPLLVLVCLAAPSVTFLLPATQDYLGEIYQPIQALKFFKTKGRQFHKYGPAPNFVLAPGYAATLAYWKVTGAFGEPSEKFPYGFTRPFEQIGFLIVQGRVLFLLLAVVGLGYLAHAVHGITGNRWAVGFALLFCVVTNYAVVEQLPSPRPDSGMIAFAALALGVYARMLFLGLSVRRGAWFSVWAVLAISSKELAAPMFVLPFLGLICIAWRDGDRQPGGREAARRAIRWSFLTGVVAYALLNVVYAPGTWAQRMQFWLSGPGIDGDVWGHGGGPVGRLIGFGACMLNNLGPGGIVIVPVALAAFLIARPPRRVMLCLPAVSVALLGVARIQYPADRFYTILCLALFLPAAVGLDALLRRPGAKPATVAALLALAGVNVWFASCVFFRNQGALEYIAERHVPAQNDRAAKYYLLNDFPHVPGSSRLEHLGLKHDPRSLPQLAAARTDLPEWIYARRGKLQFFEDARKLPARAAMIKRESGFDIATWRGLEGLGYRHEQTLEPEVPRWFWFAWMPAMKRWSALGAVEVYRLPRAGTAETAEHSSLPHSPRARANGTANPAGSSRARFSR